MQPIIRLAGVSKVYLIGSERLRALDKVDLEIFPGEFCVIVGRSGSGKSTLLNMMAGLEKPTRGTIYVAGKQIEKLSESALVRHRLETIGFVFQSFNLFATETAVDNVAMPLMFRGVPGFLRRKAARKMLSQVGLSTHMRHKPAQMSGGQQQRVGIARALVSKPKIIFADEPTGNLDSKTAYDILRLLQQVVREKGQTLIMVTHDEEMSKYAHRVVHILDGHIRKVEINEHPLEPTPPEDEHMQETPIFGEESPQEEPLQSMKIRQDKQSLAKEETHE